MCQCHGSASGISAKPAWAPPSEPGAFIARWLRRSLPPFYKDLSVVELAAQLRSDAAAAGVDLGKLGSESLAIEQIILAAINARLVSH